MSDIKKGDLVKATRKGDATVGATDRVIEIRPYYVETEFFMHRRDEWDFEVLDRPLPEIPEDLITGCRNAYIGLPSSTVEPVFYRNDWIKVINYLREHDTYNKESK